VWDQEAASVLGRRALAKWVDFPVGAEQRPLVLTGPATLFRGGFPSDGAKLAFLDGAIEPAVEVPEDVLRSLAPRYVSGSGPLPGTLHVVDASRDEAHFDTDRGPRLLPAWRVRIGEVAEPFFVLDPDIARDSWSGGVSLWSDMRATSDDDGLELIVEFTGSPARYTDYPSALVLEAVTAVAIIPIPVELSSGYRTLDGQSRTVQARLAGPLGARVAVDPGSGCAIPVVPARPHSRRPSNALTPRSDDS
jgi:hypothetical protein